MCSLSTAKLKAKYLYRDIRPQLAHLYSNPQMAQSWHIATLPTCPLGPHGHWQGTPKPTTSSIYEMLSYRKNGRFPLLLFPLLLSVWTYVFLYYSVGRHLHFPLFIFVLKPSQVGQRDCLRAGSESF